jgi:hypothetical protein
MPLSQASKMWAEAPAEVKAQFTEAAKREKEEHARMYAHFHKAMPKPPSLTEYDGTGTQTTATNQLTAEQTSFA